MAEKMIRELKRCQAKGQTGISKADSVIMKSPGKDATLVRGTDIDRELVNFGLFLELCDLGDSGLIAVFDSRKSFELNEKKYVFGQVMVVHKGVNDTECLTEEEICMAVLLLMDSEVTLNYDGEEFKAYEIY